jgi:predicted ATPase/DNA-binding winged helix-turn-helix (wHTH) protein
MTTFRFDRFELRPAKRELLVDAQPASLGARALDVLLALVERRDRVVTKNELLDVVWPGMVVEENNLQVQVSTLRKLLGAGTIATLPGRGYRFTAALDQGGTGGSVLADATAAPAARSPPSAASGAVEGRPATNLPAALPRLFGRAADLGAVRALLDAHRLVTIVGAGGIGKSRLAQAVAHQAVGAAADGVWMVELAALTDARLLSNAIAQALQCNLRGGDAAPDELAAVLADRDLLLVLDNCEHLLDDVAALVEALLARAPRLRVLATSQEPLRAAAEQQYRLRPLHIPDAQSFAVNDDGALALFEARVKAADPRFALNAENAGVAADICRQLDGLPLAIEFAAARVGTLGLLPVRDKLDARFKLLTGGARATLRRHQTLRAALEWSHNLLADAERTVFRRLGAFAGGFTIELAQAVVTDDALDEWAVLDILSALVDKSLVVVEEGESPRYRLLESARAFALEQLAAVGETDALLERHALAMRDFLQRVDGINLDGNLRTHEFAALVVPEIDNLRAAPAWARRDGCDPQVALALAAHAGSLIDYANECADWLPPLRKLVEDGNVDPALAARYWRALAAGNMATRVPQTDQLEAARRARALYDALGQPRRALSSLIQQARREALLVPSAAQASIAEARSLLGPDAPAEFRIILSRVAGTLALSEGRVGNALAHHREEVSAARSSGDWRVELIGWTNVLNAVWLAGPLEDAAREATEVVGALRRRPGEAGDMGALLANAAGIMSELGRLDEAAAITRECLACSRRAHDLFLEEWIYLCWRRGQLAAATRLIGALDARVEAGHYLVQFNEQRLLDVARPALLAAQDPVTSSAQRAEGATLSREQIYDVVAAALDEVADAVGSTGVLASEKP